MKFRKWQKVWCYYHCTRFFSPPMCGKILYKWPHRKKHHFSFEVDGKCHWYIVLMENKLIVLIPEVCIRDLKKEIERHDNNNKCPVDVIQINPWLKLNEWQAKRMLYLLNK